MKRFAVIGLFLGLMLCAVACADAPRYAVAVVVPTKGNNVHGVVWFAQEGDKVRVTADLSGLSPGQHGFHIHEYGDTRSTDGMSAGGHYNPLKMPHAGPQSAQRHEGDLGNVTADANGRAHVDFTDGIIALDGPHSIIGRSVVVHANPDDERTQPTGNAGARVGVGVIGIAAPPKAP